MRLLPSYCIKRKSLDVGRFLVEELTFPNTSASYHRFMVRELLRDIKESTFRVHDAAFGDDANASAVASAQYELPDGQVLDLAGERYLIPEQLFVPDRSKCEAAPLLGLHQMIHGAISASDLDVRRDLYTSIVLMGGSSLLPGLSERLNKEVAEIAHQKFRILSSAISSERKFSTWIGGSILASLGTFQQVGGDAVEGIFVYLRPLLCLFFVFGLLVFAVFILICVVCVKLERLTPSDGGAPSIANVCINRSHNI